MRDPVTAQTVHSEGPRPQPREAKTVSQWEQAMVTRVTFRMNLIQPSKGIERKLLVVRRSLRLVVLRTWPLDEEKRLMKQFREEMKQDRLPGRVVCLEAMKKYPPCFKVAGYQR